MKGCYNTKIEAGGSVRLPADVIKYLDLHGGDQVLFGVERIDGNKEIVLQKA